MRRLLLASLLAIAAAGMANASIIPTFVSMTNIGGNLFQYSYDVYVESPGERIQFQTTAGSGGVPPAGFDNHFTFFDFFGYVGGSASCSGSALGAGFCGNFTPGSSGMGPSAFLQNPPDTGVTNVTWTYNNAGGVIPTGSYLGRFSMNSTSNSQGTIYFSGQSTKDDGNQEGSVTGNTATTIGPVTAIPEPATLALLGMGLIALSLSYKKLARR
jgi:hypothetical protein